MIRPKVHTTTIPGLLVIDLPVPGDARGWFKENWQREKMVAAGLPDFEPVQNNISYNLNVGTTRGIHAEPWDKYISTAAGRVFGAWVDLREGESFGAVYWHEITPKTAIFVPRGVGNSFQTLEAPAAYTYLVNDHWSEAAQSQYTYLNLADESVAIPWPIPLEQAQLSAKDETHPRLSQVVPVKPRRVLVVGGSGQLGRALADCWKQRTDVDIVTREQLDIADADNVAEFDFSPYRVIVNAAAHTAVDAAESSVERQRAWACNVAGVGRLAVAARKYRATLVHVSSDYIFDGTVASHSEDEEPSPMSVYGQTKAAGDQLVATLDDYYIVRTSWVIGNGRNFVDTMMGLSERGIDPRVVDDQVGRLTFAADLAIAIDHLITVRPEAGTYNVTNQGEPVSWAQIASRVFAFAGHDAERVVPVSTAEYNAGRAALAPRPANSTLDISKIRATGFIPRDQISALRDHIEEAGKRRPQPSLSDEQTANFRSRGQPEVP